MCQVNGLASTRDRPDRSGGSPRKAAKARPSVDIDLTALEGPSPEEVPEELRGWVFDGELDHWKLSALARPACDLDVEEVLWHFELPWWRGDDDGRFQVRPVDVFEHPHRYPEHRDRIWHSDLSSPVHVVRRRRRWLIVDGIDRAAHAFLRGQRSLRAIRVSADDVKAIQALG